MRILFMDTIKNCNEEILEMLRKEPTCYFSVDKEHDASFLFTDDEKYKQISNKLDFEYDTLRDGDTLEEYIDMYYEQKYLEYEKNYRLTVSIAFIDYTECAIKTIEYLISENKFDFNKWDTETERILKNEVMLGLRFDIEEMIEKFVSDGFDISIIEGVVSDYIKYRNLENR